jgi:hypothetical protein
MTLIDRIRSIGFGYKFYPIQEYVPALNRLTKIAIDENIESKRARGLGQFITTAILKQDIALSPELIDCLSNDDLEYISIVIKHVKEIQNREFVIMPLRILLDEIKKVWPDLT